MSQTVQGGKLLLSKRLNEVTELRDKLKFHLEYHLSELQEMELTPKDRIELIGRLLPFALNKIVAGNEEAKAKQQGDPLASF